MTEGKVWKYFFLLAILVFVLDSCAGI